MILGLLLLPLAAGSAGCAHLSSDAGFPDVQTQVRVRSGEEIEWTPSIPVEDRITTRVHILLQKDLTADDAVQIALLNNRNLQATFEQLGIARADLLQARTIRNPILGGELRFPASPVSPFELMLTQDLLDILQLRKRRRLAEAAFEATKLRVANDVLHLATQVRSAFYMLQGSGQVLATRQTIVDAARTSAELAIRQHDSGNITDLDLENEQALYEKAKLDLAKSESDLLSDRETLNGLMGLWGIETEWKASLELPSLPPREQDLEKIEELAVTQRIDLSAAAQDVEVASRALPLARTTAIGPVAAGAHHEREVDGVSTTGPALEVPIPIFNWGRAARARALSVLRQNQQRYAALAVEVRAEVRSARNAVLAARSRVDYYRDVILPRRARIVDQTQLGYNGMLIGVFQLLQAKESEIEAQREYIEAQRDYWLARAELDRAAGGTVEPPATGVVPVTPGGEVDRMMHLDQGGSE